jgi:anti-anti-sigma regulatory factor
VLAFEGVLNQALATASSDIVVDLLWVQQIDAPAIQFLAQASQRASQLGKSLSFVAMDARTRRSLAEQVLQEHLHARVTWEEQITPGLEGFLSRRPARRRRYRLRRELLSQYQW